MKKIKYLIIIPALAAILVAFPAVEPVYAGSSFGFSFSYSAPFYDPYPTYFYPYSFGTSYGYWDRHDYRINHRYPRQHFNQPRHDRHFGRHRDFDRSDHRRNRGYDRW